MYVDVMVCQTEIKKLLTYLIDVSRSAEDRNQWRNVVSQDPIFVAETLNQASLVQYYEFM